jgi:hypothetical protein
MTEAGCGPIVSFMQLQFLKQKTRSNSILATRLYINETCETKRCFISSFEPDKWSTPGLQIIALNSTLAVASISFLSLTPDHHTHKASQV